MSSDLTREQIVDLLNYLGSAEIRDYNNKDNIQFCCTVHKETHPSAGVSVPKQQYNCFACGSRGTLDWLVHKSDEDQFPSIYHARKFLEKRYNIDFEKEDREVKGRLLYYGEKQTQDDSDLETERKVLPRKALAPFRSGKETYKYFYTRGFDKHDLQEFEVGRDLKNKTVTVPIRYEDGQLSGFVGRFIDPNRPKHERYMVYEFKRGQMTYPQDRLEVIDDTIILVEGLFDAMWLHKLGFKNAQSILGNRVTTAQAKYLKSKASKFIRMFDADKGGRQAKELYAQVMGDVTTYDVDYPEGVKDPQELTKEQIITMIEGKYNPFRRRLKKI